MERLGRATWRQSREVTVERSGKLPRYKIFTDLRRAVAHQQEIRDWEQDVSFKSETSASN